MDISHILSSFKTEEEYYSILEDKIISKVDWEKKILRKKNIAILILVFGLSIYIYNQ